MTKLVRNVSLNQRISPSADSADAWHHAFRKGVSVTSGNQQLHLMRCQTRDFLKGESGAVMANPDNPYFPQVAQAFPGCCGGSPVRLKYRISDDPDEKIVCLSTPASILSHC